MREMQKQSKKVNQRTSAEKKLFHSDPGPNPWGLLYSHHLLLLTVQTQSDFSANGNEEVDGAEKPKFNYQARSVIKLWTQVISSANTVFNMKRLI